MISVILTTYNSGPWLAPQLQSVFAQQGVEVSVLARDDGSTDGTLPQLRQFATENRLTILPPGPRLGPARGFLSLLRQSPQAESYAFCDHDDVWLPDKLSCAMAFLRDHPDRPALYFCQTRLVDAQLRPLPTQVPLRPRLTFGEALVWQFIGGCTMVFNEPLRRILLRHSPEYLPMHDVWGYLVALAVGAEVRFDPTPHILYRQHGTNAVGQGQGALHELRLRLRRLLRREHARSRLARELLLGYRDLMPPERVRLAQTVAQIPTSLRARLAALRSAELQPAERAVGRRFRLAALLGTV